MKKDTPITAEVAKTAAVAEHSSRRKMFLKDDVTYVVHAHMHLHMLEWNHFICAGFVWSFPLLFIINSVHLTLSFGLAPVLIAYFAISIIYNIPLMMAYLFFGSYSRKGYMELWEMVPILRGFSWSASVFTISLELFNVTLAGIALLYILELLSLNMPWKDCKFKGAPALCLSMNTTTPFTKMCCLYGHMHNCTDEMREIYVHSSTVEYFYNRIIKIPPKTSAAIKEEIQVPLVLAVFSIWFLILLLMVCGFQKFIKFITLTFTVLAYVFIAVSIGLLILIGNKLPSFWVSNSNFNILMNLSFWVDIIAHCTLTTIPSNFVILGAMAPQKLIPVSQSIKIFIIQYIFMVLFTTWLSVSIQTLTVLYQVTDIKCIKANGIVFLFAIIPDLLTRSTLPHLLLFIWFFSIWLLGFSSALFTMTAFLESLEQASPKIFRVRIYFCAILCIILFSINIFLLTNSFLITFKTWNLIVFRHLPLILIFIFSIGILLYSVRRLNNDYYFIYGKSLRAYWTQSYKLILLISFFCVTFGFLLTPVHDHLDPRANLFFPNIYIIITLIPILIIAIVTYMIYKNKNEVLSALTPTAKWGPPSFIKKQARLRFNPDKNASINDKNNICSHSCLLNSQTFKKEMKLLSLNCSYLTDVHFEEKFNKIRSK